MNDDQCKAILDAVKSLTRAISHGSENIIQAIEGIYSPDNDGIEKRLDRLIETLWDIAEKEK